MIVRDLLEEFLGKFVKEFKAEFKLKLTNRISKTKLKGFSKSIFKTDTGEYS